METPRATIEPTTAAATLAGPPTAAQSIEAEEVKAVIAESDSRMEFLERARADGAGIPYEVWVRFSKETRDELATKIPQVQRDIAQGQSAPMAMNRQQSQALPMIDIERYMPSLRSPDDFANHAVNLLGPDDYDIKGNPVYVPMCDPYIELVVDGHPVRYHPDVSKIPVKSIGQKQRRGFTATPAYPFIPKPDKPCPLTDAAVWGMQAKPCTYLGRDDTEVNDHMKATHPNEYRSLREVEAKADREREIGESRASRETIQQLLAELVASRKGVNDATG